MNTRLVILLLTGLLLVSCSPNKPIETAVPQPEQPTVPAEAAPANPAAVYCQSKGHTWELREGDGGSYGVCIFAGGSECDEWAYFLGECQPAMPTEAPTAAPESTATAEPVPDGWQIYENENPAYSFLYPAEATIEPGQDPQRAVTILGPLVEDENWPMFYIGHPQDRAEYRPPADVELEQWLVEQSLVAAEDQPGMGEVRREGREIGGETAVHTRFERSQQSYAYDKYFFAHAGQLYSIVILHTGDQEDWELYNQFLDSFQFREELDVETAKGQESEAQDERVVENDCAAAGPGEHQLLDAADGICFLYPDDYDVFQGEDGALTFYQGSLLNTEAPLATVRTEAANGRTLAQVTAQRSADFAFPGTDAEAVSLGGQPAALLDNLPGQDTNRRVVVLYNDRVYDLVVSRIGDAYGAVGEQAAAFYDMVSESWQFTAIAPDAPLLAGPECPAAEAGTLLFSNAEDGYCLLLPEGYEVDDSLTSSGGGAETAVYVGSPLDAARARSFITVDDAADQSLEEITLAHEAEIESALPGSDVSWTFGIMLDGEPANEFAQVPGQDLSRQVLLVHNGRLYTLTFIPDDPDAGEAYAEMQLLYETMIESFHFLQR